MDKKNKIETKQNKQEEIETLENKQKEIETLENKQEEIETKQNKQEEIETLENKQEEIETKQNKQEEIETLENKQKEIETLENKQEEIETKQNKQEEIETEQSKSITEVNKQEEIETKQEEIETEQSKSITEVNKQEEIETKQNKQEEIETEQSKSITEVKKKKKLITEIIKEGDIINFNLFESKEIDLLPPLKKQRRKPVDDYDYNDPFLESFDGELDPIFIDCKLENFFIYKGELIENIKNIIKKYKKEKKKIEMKKKAEFEKKKIIKDVKEEEFTFSFEKMINIKQNNKNKKEPIYMNIIGWLFYYENELISSYISNSDNKNDINLKKEQIFDFQKKEIFNYFLENFEFLNEKKNNNSYLSSENYENIQKNNNSFVNFIKENMDISFINVFTNNNILNTLNNQFKIIEIEINNEEKTIYLKKLIDNVEKIYCCILKELTNENNYNTEKKTFLNFRSDNFIHLIISFYMNYIKYYYLNFGENIIKSKNKASKYLLSGFYDTCTNSNRLKFYIRRYIEEFIINNIIITI